MNKLKKLQLHGFCGKFTGASETMKSLTTSGVYGQDFRASIEKIAQELGPNEKAFTLSPHVQLFGRIKRVNQWWRPRNQSQCEPFRPVMICPAGSGEVSYFEYDQMMRGCIGGCGLTLPQGELICDSCFADSVDVSYD